MKLNTRLLPSHDLTIIAKFANNLDLVQLSVVNPVEGVVQLSSIDLNAGDSATAIAQPSNIYEFVGWFEDDTLVSNETNYAFIVPTSPITLEAKFARVLFNLTIIDVTPDNAMTIISSNYYRANEQINLPTMKANILNLLVG
jgi:hypothetical protein